MVVILGYLCQISRGLALLDLSGFNSVSSTLSSCPDWSWHWHCGNGACKSILCRKITAEKSWVHFLFTLISPESGGKTSISKQSVRNQIQTKQMFSIQVVLKYILSCNIYQPMVNWWFGLVVWIFGIPLWKGLLLRGTPIRIPHHRAPNPQFSISWI